MAEHYRTLSAVFPMIFRKGEGNRRQVLLHQRANTGYMDGMWDFAGSGHVDEGETAGQAAVRECKEETGLDVDIADLSFAHLAHRVGHNGARTYYDIYFEVRRFSGIPVIAEPEKCSGMEWFDLEQLPANMIPIRKKSLENYQNAIYYSESI